MIDPRPPLVLVLILLAATLGQAQPFRADIDRWVAQDALSAPPKGSVLFTGSSSIRRWEQLSRDFADYKIIQRGFGGSQFEDLNRYVAEIVLPYRPAAIVVWEGTNDIKAGETGDEVAADYRAFIDAVHAQQPAVEIFWLGIMPTPGRYALEAENTRANTLIRTLADGDDRLHYIDLPAAFNALNPPSGESFRSKFVDPIHLNREGYKLWTSVIRPQLESVLAPNKVFTPNNSTLRPGERLLFDFGPSNPECGDPTVGPDAHGRFWNNWHQAEGGVAVNAGERLANLIDTQGEATGINLTITGGFATNGKLQGGLLDPSETRLGDLAVATATQDYFFSSADDLPAGGNDDRPGGLMLDGLNPNHVYKLRFFGSRSTTQTCVTEYLVAGANRRSTQLHTSGQSLGADGGYDGNNSTVAEVAGVRPDRFGQVFIDVNLIEGSYAYLNVFELSVELP